MNSRSIDKTLTIKALHWVLGIVIFIESLIVVLNYQEIMAADHIALPAWMILLLAGAEMMGAVLFLIPHTIKIGSYLLVIIFGMALLIHLLHGQYNIGGLLIYAAAVIAVNEQLQIVKNEKVNIT